MSGTGTVSAAAPSINSCVKSLRITAAPIWSAAFRAIQASVTTTRHFSLKDLQSTAQTVISPSTHTLDSSLCIQNHPLIVGYLVRNNISNDCSATVLYLRLHLSIQMEPNFRPIRPKPIGAQQHDQVTHLQKGRQRWRRNIVPKRRQ